ncbi:hypothetical protein BJV74DRAFT_394286 [Russula compacta]|nr:hypothetical protein BJV74DRAFT_394286 [Russula compacta]
MFRQWRPSKQRTSASSHTSPRTAPSCPYSHSEDAQPNESVDKRQRYPPAVNRVVIRPPSGRVRQGPRQDAQFSGSMRPTSGGLKTPSAAQPASNHTCMSGNFASVPSTSTHPRGAPAPKRRKLENSPLTRIKRGHVTEKMMAFTSSVSSETLVGEHRVKRERSISPELSVEPQLITAGSKRYAPLPPQCEKSRPGYRAARNAWAQKEKEALKRLGLKVVRTLIREDGMVIDW